MSVNPIVDSWMESVKSAVKTAYSNPSTIPEVPGISREEFQHTMKLFVSLTLQKFLGRLNLMHTQNPNFVFSCQGELSSFFWELLEATQYLSIPVWCEIFCHPTMKFFQESFLKKQDNAIRYLESQISS